MRDEAASKENKGALPFSNETTNSISFRLHLLALALCTCMRNSGGV